MLLVEPKLFTKFEVVRGSKNLAEYQIWENPTFFKEYYPGTGFLVPTFSVHVVPLEQRIFKKKLIFRMQNLGEVVRRGENFVSQKCHI